jgi:endoglucanase
VPSSDDSQANRYFLPGPIAAFQPQPDVVYLNPSYLAPYAFRLFAQVDRNHDWTSLIDSSYQVLFDSTALSAAQLPGDWVALNTLTGELQPLPASSALKSTYSFDAYRVWWRVNLDAVWFAEPRATQFLQTHLSHLQQLWQADRAIPARFDLQGKALVTYEAIAQYAMLYPALRTVDPIVAEEILNQKLLPAQTNGIWENDSAYYVQNLAWFGLFPAETVERNLLKPSFWDAIF